MVSKRRFTDGQKVLGTQDKETKRLAAVSKVGHRNLQEVGLSSSHSVLCAVTDVFFMIGTSTSVYSSEEEVYKVATQKTTMRAVTDVFFMIGTSTSVYSSEEEVYKVATQKTTMRACSRLCRQ